MASIDQSKLNVDGHNNKLKLNVGRYENVRKRVYTDVDFAAGLSAVANVGVIPDAICIRRTSNTNNDNPSNIILRNCF